MVLLQSLRVKLLFVSCVSSLGTNVGWDSVDLEGLSRRVIFKDVKNGLEINWLEIGE